MTMCVCVNSLTSFSLFYMMMMKRRRRWNISMNVDVDCDWYLWSREDVCCCSLDEMNEISCRRTMMMNEIDVYDLFFDDSTNDYDVVCLDHVYAFEVLKN